MSDPRDVLDEVIYDLFVRQDELRVRLFGKRADLKESWEALHRQLGILNDGYIRCCHDVDEPIAEDWASFKEMASAIDEEFDRIEASLQEGVSSSPARSVC